MEYGAGLFLRPGELIYGNILLGIWNDNSTTTDSSNTDLIKIILLSTV